MGSRDEYLRILAAHGRRVANRFAFAELRESGHVPTHAEFTEGEHEMYGPEGHLPVDERSRPDNGANAFDPLWWFKRYRPDWPLRAASTVKGTTQDWPSVLRETYKAHGADGLDRTLLLIQHLLEGHECAYEYVDQPGHEEWKVLEESWNEADLIVLHMLVYHKFPAHDSEIAELWLKKRTLKDKRNEPTEK